MGPRPDGRGKYGLGNLAAAALLRQWGRGQTAAESADSLRKVAAGEMASMGPRPDGRGKRPAGTARDAPTSVNGAAARRPRKANGWKQ